MSRVELHYGAATDVGQVREVNEDSYLAAPPLFVVADGMGGHDGGDVASRIVVEEFARLAEEGYDPRRGSEAVADTLTACHDRITEYAEEQSRRTGRDFQAGTTAVVALLVEDDEAPKWLLVNLGDSRIYRFVDGELEQVSVDHSLVQELVDEGSITREEMGTHPARHVVTRALGGPDRADADYFLLPLPRAERILLCSDGITEMIDDEAVATIVGEAVDPRDAADRLVAEAVRAGGRDNATAVVVDVMGLESDRAYDSERQRVSLELKLGALPNDIRSHDALDGDTRSYRPGDWFGIFGDQATVVLPPSEKARVPGLWALVDAGAGFDEVLDALIADGLRDLPGFVLVSEADGETKVVLRGAATAVFTTAGETVTVEGSSVTTWAERSLTDVRTMRIDVADGPDSPDLVIRDGLVRISRTDRPATTRPDAGAR